MNKIFGRCDVTIPIVGCKTVEQLTESLKAVDLVLEPKIVNYLRQAVEGEGI